MGVAAPGVPGPISRLMSAAYDLLDADLDPAVTYDGPVECADLRFLVALLHQTYEQYGLTVLPLHPVAADGSRACVSPACRVLTDWHRDLARPSVTGDLDAGTVAAMYPAGFVGADLIRLGEREFPAGVGRIRDLVAGIAAIAAMLGGRDPGDGADEELVGSRLAVYRPVPRGGQEGSWCPQVRLFAVPDSIPVFLTPLLDCVRWLGPVPPVPDTVPGSVLDVDLGVYEVDGLSRAQLAAVGFDPDDLAAAQGRSHRTSTLADLPFTARATDVCYPGVTFVWPGPLPGRMEPPSWLPMLHAYPTPLMRLSLDGPVARVVAPVDWACGQTGLVEIAGLSGPSFTSPDETIADGEHDVAVTAVLYADQVTWITEDPDLDQGAGSVPQVTPAGDGQTVVTGRVSRDALLVNEVTRVLFRQVDLDVTLACPDLFHDHPTWESGATLIVRVYFPDDGSDVVRHAATVLHVVGVLVLTGREPRD